MELEGKIQESNFWKEVENQKAPNKPHKVHFLKVEGWGKQLKVNAQEENPPHLAVGQTIKLKVYESDSDKYDRASRVFENNFKKGSFSGGGKAKVRTFAETKRMCKGTAIKAAATLNKAHGQVVVGDKDCNTIANFVIGEIRGDIPKWDSIEGELMISRQTAIHAAAEEYEAHQIHDAERLIEVAKEKYNYIIS